MLLLCRTGHTILLHSACKLIFPVYFYITVFTYRSNVARAHNTLVALFNELAAQLYSNRIPNPLSDEYTREEESLGMPSIRHAIAKLKRFAASGEFYYLNCLGLTLSRRHITRRIFIFIFSQQRVFIPRHCNWPMLNW